MAKLEALRPLLTDIGGTLMQADGYALWLASPGEISPVVLKTLEDYGGMPVAESEGQALWFFFSEEIFLAAARLSVWARFNALLMTLQIFPAQLKAGENNSKNLSFDASFWGLDNQNPASFSILVHSSLWSMASGTPGLGIAEETEEGWPYGPDWRLLTVDSRLPYESRLNWFTLLRPVGNPVDKDFQAGWREFFPHLEAILQRGKFRFTVHDFYLMFPVDSLRRLKEWCRDFIALVERIKVEHPDQYWPCVLAVIERKGLNINADLPVKSNIPWQHLVPDYPHMSLYSAFSLGSEFAVHRVRFATPTGSPEDWASVSLRGEEESSAASLPHLSPPALVLGGQRMCFYCGQTSHAPADCPSRFLAPLESGIWTELAKLNLDAIQSAMGEVQDKLADLQEEERREYLSHAIREPDAPGIMLRAFYDLAWPLQARSISFFWRLRGKDISKAAKDLAPMDKNSVWDTLEDFVHSGGEKCRDEVKHLLVKYPKDYRALSLSGFVAMESGDHEKAESLWKEAERCSPTPAVQAWHVMLQARAYECLGKFSYALKLYRQVCLAFPNWQEPVYRNIVCLVKGGFTQPALALLLPLIDRNGHIFNRAIIDPEMERGYIQVQAALGGHWAFMEQRAKHELDKLKSLNDELSDWFVPGNEFAVEMAGRIESLAQLGEIRNYVAFQRLYLGRLALEKDLQNHVNKKARDFKERFRAFTGRLKVIHEESVWFPFPSVLVEFNKNYSKSVANVNWALLTSFHAPEAFKKAQAMIEEETARIKKLEKRLAFLRIIRDATLFILSMMETFFWLIVVGLLLIFVIFPLVMLYGDKFGLDVTNSILAQERWQVQKGLFFAVSVIALFVSVLKTVLRFERIRDKILAKAKAKSEAIKESQTRSRTGGAAGRAKNAVAKQKG